MNAKDILDKIKAVFNATEVIPVPTKLQTSFPVDGQQPVYVDGDALAIGSPAYLDAALTMPYPDGTYTVTGGQSFTVTAGLVSAVGDAAPAAQQQAPLVPPAVLPMMPQMPPMFETQLAAHQTELQAAQKEIAKLNKIIPDLFALVEKLTELPTTEPKTLNERQQAVFNRVDAREKRLETIATTIKNLKSK